MLRILLAINLLFLTITASASHFLGGELSWECDGNGNYIFQVVKYRDCSSAGFGTSPVIINWNGGSPISCALTDSNFISPQSFSGTQSISCDTTIIYTPVKRYVYRSAPMTIPLPVINSGYQFWVSESGRPATDNTNGTTNGIMLRAAMHTLTVASPPGTPGPCYDNSPVFDEAPLYAFNTGSNQFYFDGIEMDPQDSIFFDWAPSWNSGTSFPAMSLSYDTAYAFNQPLPGPAFNPLNEGAQIQPNGFTTFKSLTQGRFSVCYKIESYRNGQIISTVFRDFEMQIYADPGIPGVCSVGGNNNPTLALQYYSGFDTLTPTYSNNKLIGYELDVLVGTPIKFNVVGQDYDLLPNCSPQVLTATANGPALAFPSAPCQNGPCATLTSLNAGGGFVSSLNNSVRFDWTPDTNHVDPISKEGTHTFMFSMRDNNGILPATSQMLVKINVRRPISVSPSTLNLCLGDSDSVLVEGDVSNLSWSPTTNISCTTCANPTFSPVTNTSYTVTDLNSGYSETVEVLVDSALALPQLVLVGNDLVLSNGAAFDTVVWYRNQAPFYPASVNTYAPFLSGTYWVESANGACVVESQRIQISSGNNMASTTDTTGSWFDTRMANLTHGFTFRLSGESYYTLDGIYVHAFSRNMQNDLSTVQGKIYNQQLQAVFISDSVVRISDDIIKIYGEANLGGNEDYLMGIYTDTSLAVPTFKPNAWPVIANDGRVAVFNATNAAGNTIPTNNAPDYPFVHFSLKWGIGIAETIEPSFMVYPNPAKDVLYVAASAESDYALNDALGRKVLSGKLAMQGEIDLANLPAGVYLLHLEFVNGSTATRKIIIE